MESLPVLALELILEYLPVSDLLSLRATSILLNETVTHAYVWRRRGDEMYALHGASFEQFMEESKKCGRYQSCIGRFRKAFATIKRLHPKIQLRNGATEQELDELENVQGVTLHLQQRALWTVHFGQDPSLMAIDSCLGCATFYDCCLAYIIRGPDFDHSDALSLGVDEALPIFSFGGNLPGDMVVDPISGRLLSSGREMDMSVSWVIAPSLVDYICSFAEKLESGAYRALPETGVSLFQVKGIPTLITRGVGVSCSPLFIAPASEASTGLVLVFAYQIRIFGTPQVEKCQLVSREWIIEKGDGGPEEIVAGPGVIGYTPEVFPGSEFKYESMCQCEGNGSMRGKFVFRNQDSGELFDVIVPQFLLVAPPTFP